MELILEKLDAEWPVLARSPEARRALEMLATKREMEDAPTETILREALLVLT